MAQDTNVENLIINKLTKAQYESIANPDLTQLYFITDEVISSADVISALGYTPYSNTNPNNYTSNIGTVTSVNGAQPDTNGNVEITIPSITIDRTYDPTSENPQSGIAINGAGFLKNVARHTTDSIGIGTNFTTVNGDECIVIGDWARSTHLEATSNKNIVIGNLAQVFDADNSIAVGYSASVNASNSIQLGTGTNRTANTLQIESYTLLNTSTGLIPDERLSTNIARISNIPDITDMATQTWVQNQNYVKSVNDIEPDSNGNVEITIPTVNIDNSTITKNTSDELQAIGVIDNNSGNALKYWTGTKAQYDAIATKDATTLYNITDDTDVTLSLLKLLFPVGAVYFGTMATCPLQTLGVGTWQALPSDKVIQIAGTRGSVGTTINESLPNIKGTATTGILWGSGASATGCFTQSGSGGNKSYPDGSDTIRTIDFSASRSSSAYQDNAPVQQDAYLLNGWRRIA